MIVISDIEIFYSIQLQQTIQYKYTIIVATAGTSITLKQSIIIVTVNIILLSLKKSIRTFERQVDHYYACFYL